MHFNWFFSAKANFKVCIEVQNFRSPFYPYQFLLLSTNVLNDLVLDFHHWMFLYGHAQFH